MRLLPNEVGVGRPGLIDRLDRASAEWFAAMREGLSAVDAAELTSMLTTAGYEIAGSRLARLRFDAPLSDVARRVVIDTLERTRAQLGERLDADDRATLDVLLDADDPRGVLHRADTFVAASRQIVIARPMAGPFRSGGASSRYAR